MDRSRFLVCPPKYFDVQYVINHWMRGNVGKVVREDAQTQWNAFVSILQQYADVSYISPLDQFPDMTFVANAGLVYKDHFIASKFRYPQRAGEREPAIDWFRAHHYHVHTLSNGSTFEGEGDALFELDRPVLWCGYGFRSGLYHHREIGTLLQVDVRPLQLIDKRFYHLDTCLTLFPEQRAMYYPGAFAPDALKVLRRSYPDKARIEIDEEDALRFACNAVVTDSVFITPSASEKLKSQLYDWGFTVIETPLDQFMLAGGAAKCLVLNLDNGSRHEERVSIENKMVDARITLQGQLIDSDQFNESLDCITRSGCGFEIEEFLPGWDRDQDSLANVHILAPNGAKLEALLPQLRLRGATVDFITQEAVFRNVERDGVAPQDFYASTIYPTEVYMQGRWHLILNQRMDAAVVGRMHKEELGFTTSLIRDLRKGDRVVCGHEGIRVMEPREGEAGDDEELFRFMGGSVSTERLIEVDVESVARQMHRIHSEKGKIIVVAGPPVIHTGGGASLSTLIREGYVQAVLSGNGLAVHDIECNLYGTSLGVDIESGETHTGGHAHHLRAINAVRDAGSIGSLVQNGLLSSGIFYECIKQDIPFVLAGSIRDDGPLPETELNIVAAQEAYRKQIEGADMILMLSSMLHSIAVGNMTKSSTPLFCVDINPAVIVKLRDRGSLESRGIVTDVGLFLKSLLEHLHQLSDKESSYVNTSIRK